MTISYPIDGEHSGRTPFQNPRESRRTLHRTSLFAGPRRTDHGQPGFPGNSRRTSPDESHRTLSACLKDMPESSPVRTGEDESCSAGDALALPEGVAVLGVDPGFAACGVALVRLLPTVEEVALLDVIRTAKDSARRRTYASDDNLRRARELHRALDGLVVTHNVRAIAAEAMSFPRNATSAAKMSLCWGVLASIAEARELPIVQGSPQALKRAVTGSTTASKDEVEFALLKRFGNDVEGLFTGPDGLREHCFDALAAVVACLDSEPLRLARSMVRANASARTLVDGVDPQGIESRRSTCTSGASA